MKKHFTIEFTKIPIHMILVRQVKSAVSNMKFYCKNIHNQDVSNVILELKRQDSIGVLFNFLNDFVEWLEDHFMRVQLSRFALFYT